LAPGGVVRTDEQDPLHGFVASGLRAWQQELWIGPP
jgi:hypothetical protein